MGSKPWHNPQTLNELYNDKGLSLREIADKFDISAQSVTYWMDKYGIERQNSPAEQTHASLVQDYTGDYMVWRVMVDGTQHSVRVHRLLAVSEYGLEAVNGNHVHHKNGIPWDNRIENLEIMNPEEHTEHHRPEWEQKRRESVRGATTGEENTKAKLTESDVIEIRRRYNNGENAKEISGDYNVSHKTVWSAASGKTWSHVGEQD